MTSKEQEHIVAMGEKFSGDAAFFEQAVKHMLETLEAEMQFTIRMGKTMIKLFTRESKMLFIEILFRKSWGNCFSICFCSHEELNNKRLHNAQLPPNASENVKAYRVNIATFTDIDEELINWLRNSYKIFNTAPRL